MGKSNVSLEETLLPALLQCFGIMFLGFILGKFDILRQNETKGISTFVQYLALPALVFLRISTLSFQDIKWAFIASVFVAKASIFICVALMTILLTHPADLGKAGMYAIATTQSNDFALAYPMVMSLYQNTHPNYSEYLYIIAPIQLLVLNTIGFFVIEIQKHKLGENTTNLHFLKIIINTLKNPVVFMTVFGMIWNVSFGNKVLTIFDDIIKSLSAAFPATALLLVGHTMAVKGGKSDNHIPMTVALLIITKNLILPIILQKFSTFMLQESSQNEIQSLSCFGFLYGTTPTAPSVYVFSVQYDISVDVITKTIIGSTLLSAPLMFASSSVISISQFGIENIPYYLSLTISYLSSASLLCCSGLLIFYVIGKRFHSISFGVTLYIFFSQLLTSIGGFLLFFTERDNNSPIFYAQYILSIGGSYATRVCTLFLAILLIIIRWRSLCYILQVKKHINIISVLCLIFPYIIASLALLAKNEKSDGPNCQLGYAQTITTFIVTIICYIGTILCLVLQHICFRKKMCETTKINTEENYQVCEEEQILSSNTSINNEKTTQSIMAEEDICIDVEDLDKHFENLLASCENLCPDHIEENLCDSRYDCSTEKRLECATTVSTYNKEEKSGLYDDRQIFKHTTILIAMSVAMTVSLAVCFWKLILEEVNGIFIELEFLDVIINYSLGILFFIIFGFNKGLIHTMSNKWKILWHHKKRNQIEISSNDICQEFITKYERKFKVDIEKSKIPHCSEYHNLFCSSDLIKWLINNSVVEDISEAEDYILSLQEGNIIKKVDNCELFPEDVSIFRFINTMIKI